MDKWCCILGLGADREIAVSMGTRKDDPPRGVSSHGRLLTEDRQDDVITDCRVGQEACGVSRIIHRLLWSAGAEGVVAYLCSGAVVRGPSKNGRRDRLGVRQGSPNLTTFPRIDQVG